MKVVVENTTLHIARILVMRPKLRMPRSSKHLLGVVVGAMVDVEVDAVVGAKVTSRIVAMIRRMGIKMIMEIFFKRGQCLDVIHPS